MWLTLGFYRHKIALTSEGFCLHANLKSRALQAQIKQGHAINCVLFIYVLEWERRLHRLCNRDSIPDWLAIPLIVTPKLGHILFVAINGNKPVAISVVDNLYVDALDDNVSSVAREIEILRITAEDDRCVEASPGIFCVEPHNDWVVRVNAYELLCFVEATFLTAAPVRFGMILCRQGSAASCVTVLASTAMAVRKY